MSRSLSFAESKYRQNKFLFKEDTTNIDLYIKRPNSDVHERINLNSTEIIVQKASDNSDYMIEYSPNKLTDGKYNLSVQIADVLGNKSGIKRSPSKKSLMSNPCLLKYSF